MAATLDVTCPNCATPLKVPATLVGKKVRCKQCEQVLTVPAAAPPKPAEAYQSAAQKRHAEEDEESDGKNYGVTAESDAPRCPHCAKELDPPDAKICLHCGYDTLSRRRNESRKVYQPTFGDWAKHLAPPIVCTLVAAGLITGAVICWMNMSDWLAGSIIEMEEKDPITDKKKTYVKPWCFSLWISMVALWISYKLGKFAILRFVLHFRPPERVKK